MAMEPPPRMVAGYAYPIDDPTAAGEPVAVADYDARGRFQRWRPALPDPKLHWTRIVFDDGSEMDHHPGGNNYVRGPLAITYRIICGDIPEVCPECGIDIWDEISPGSNQVQCRQGHVWKGKPEQ
jgi:hypothetical protein